MWDRKFNIYPYSVSYNSHTKQQYKVSLSAFTPSYFLSVMPEFYLKTFFICIYFSWERRSEENLGQVCECKQQQKNHN